MITDYNVTDYYNEDYYNDYYRQSTDWDKYYNGLAERADQEYEDMEEN
ncbi:MAG: hypothetical protein ACI4UU_00725 [Clostridia bacterium]